MALLVDSANALDGPALVAAGYHGACRYLSKYPAHVIRPAERDSLLAAGADIVLVYEDQTGDASSGPVGGANNAYRAVKQAHDLGLPAGAAIYFACDDNTATAAQVRPYYAAVRPIVTEAGWRVGFYGPMSPARALLEDGTVDLGWVVETWTDGGELDPFHLMQLVGPLAIVGGVQCDENQILRADYGGWHVTIGEAMARFPNAVDACKAPGGGVWVLGSDGGVGAYGGAPFQGSYPALPKESRAGERGFLTIVPNDRGGYDLLADDGASYSFPV